MKSELLLGFLKKTRNKLSSLDIKDASGLSQNMYNKSIKLLGLNFHSIKSFLNKGEGNLIADFVMIPAHGNDFVFPFNPIYNYNSHCYENCLVIMFICFEMDGKIYPLLFDYWISKIYHEKNELYLSKTNIFIKGIEYLIKEGLNINTILFDAAFFNKSILENISKLGIKIVTRCSKTRKLELNGLNKKTEEIFKSSFNGNFYYYHGYQNFLNVKEVKVLGICGKVVAIANNKVDLLNKKLFYLFTNNLELSSVKILALYKRRWKIESFFKILKSYLTLSVFYRNNYEYVDERINLALAGFFIIQEMSDNLKITFYQTLKLFQKNELESLFKTSFQNTSKYFYTFV